MIRRLLFLGPMVAVILGVFTTAPAGAYGPEQFQTAFSFNCNAPVSGGICNGLGFWGWCAFGGNGTTGDCEFSVYNFDGKLGLPAFGPTHLSINYNSWTIGTGSHGLPTQPNLTTFFATGPGTLTLTGPGASILQHIFPSSFTCPSTPTSSPNFVCDTGIPAVPGHYTYSQIPLFPTITPQPGLHFDVQVTQIKSVR